VTEKGDVKLADFGVSEKLERTLGEIAGTPLWMAPEVAKRGEFYNHKSDIWSLGITLIELIDGVPPLAELNAYRVMLAIQKNDPPTVANPKEVSSQFLDFLSKCLVKDYNLRWGTAELLKHSFLSNAKKADLKVLLEKTLKKREIHKRNQVPLIDHTSLASPVESPRSPPSSEPEKPVVSYVGLDQSVVRGPSAADSMILHSSTSILPTVTEIPPEKPKHVQALAWQQPGYATKDDEDTKQLERQYTPHSEPPSPRKAEATPLLKSQYKSEEEKSCCSSCTIL